MQAKIEERHNRAEAVQGAGGVRAADDAEERLGPVGIVELERHAGEDEQEEAGHDQEMQEALEGHEAGEPFIVGLGLDLGFAELLRVVQVKVKRAHEPDEGVQAEEGEDADQQAGHAEKDRVEQRIILAVERVGVGLVFGEPDRRGGMTLLARGQDVGLGEPRGRVGGRQHVVMAVAVVAGGDIGGDVRLAQGHGFAVVGVAIMLQPVLRGISRSAGRWPS